MSDRVQELVPPWHVLCAPEHRLEPVLVAGIDLQPTSGAGQSPRVYPIQSTSVRPAFRREAGLANGGEERIRSASSCEGQARIFAIISNAFRAAGVSTRLREYPSLFHETPGIRNTRHLTGQRFSRTPWPPRAAVQRQSRPLLVSFDRDQLPRKRRETQANKGE